MKFIVRADLVIDTADYQGVEDSPEGAEDLVDEMLHGMADLPEEVTITSVELLAES